MSASFSVTLRDLAATAPTAPAVTCGDATLTRAELNRGVDRVAHHFASLGGVGPGDRVTIALPNSIGFVESALACWLLAAGGHPAAELASPPGHRARGHRGIGGPKP